jgi:steroid delta-isomerase-like uncharacterized protein
MTAPTATPLSMPAVAADPLAQRRATFAEYFDAVNAGGDFARFFHPDVAFYVIGGPQASGRDEVEATIRAIHTQAFDAQMRKERVFVDENGAIAELTFIGTHKGEFAGVPATGRSVKVPYVAAYDFASDGQITELRIYIPMQVLMAQLGVAQG